MKSIFLVFALLGTCASCSTTAPPPSKMWSNARISEHLRTLYLTRKDHRLGILQGMTDAHSTQISIVSPGSETPKVVLESADASAPPKVISPLGDFSVVYNEFGDWRVATYTFVGLTPRTLYTLKVRNQAGLLLDERQLKTIDPNRKNAKIVVTSCMDDGLQEVEQAMWAKVWAQKPDMLFIIGDAVYLDRNLEFNPDEEGYTPTIILRRHLEARGNLELYHQGTLIPTLAIWDDHDFGPDNADSTFALEKDSYSFFEKMFPRDLKSPNYERGPALSLKFQAFGHTFLFLDDRMYRTPNYRGGASETVFGKEQEDWLWKKVADSPASDTLWLINGSQYFGAYYKEGEAFEATHPETFKKFVEGLKAIEQPYLLVSGDIHASEIMKLPKSRVGQDTYEISTSGIHAKIFERHWKEHPNPYFWDGNDKDYNFAVIEFRKFGRKTNYRTTAVGYLKPVLWQHFFSLPQ